VALGVGGLVSGCDSDAKLAKSALGESCGKTADCDDGLKCVQGACYKSSSSSGGSANNEGGDGTGATPPVVVPPVLGDEGESCTKRADCKDGLGCFSQRCTKSEATGEGGEGNTPTGPTLGSVGETCGLTSDCSKGLACLPSDAVFGGISAKAAGSNSIGVCTQLDTGVKPTGKECGAECEIAADCCELPIVEQTTTGAASCTDLGKLVDAVPDCAVATGVNGAICLAFNSYCDENCGKNTWACTNGACQFATKCTKATAVVGGCPSYTRGGTPIPACDVKSGKCVGTVVEAVGCTTDAKCATMVVADHPTDTCVAGECVCHKESGGCYRKCSEPADCDVGYTCDADSTLCVPVAGCKADFECIKSKGDITAKCTDGACQIPCEHDIDCNRFGFKDGEFGQVCSSGACVVLGCETSDECPAFTGGLGVKSFCTTPRTPVDGVVIPRSAITD
jgi:hypothetical protein